MKNETIYEEAKLLVDSANTEELELEANEVVNLAFKQADLKDELAQVNAELAEVIKIPAPADLIEDYLEAIKSGQSLNDYLADQADPTMTPKTWNLDLYIMPTTDEFKALKKEAYRIKKARNLENYNGTIDTLNEAYRAKTLVVNTNRIKPRKSGGYSFSLTGAIEGAKQSTLTHKEKIARLRNIAS